MKSERQLGSGGESDHTLVDPDGLIVQDASVCEQTVVGEEDPLEPLRLDQRAERRDVVDESIAPLHERHVRELVQRLRGARAAIAAADHHDGRTLPCAGHHPYPQTSVGSCARTDACAHKFLQTVPPATGVASIGGSGR